MPGGGPQNSGWLANYLGSTTADGDNPIYAASVTQGLSRALYGPGHARVPYEISDDTYRLR